MVFIEPTEEEIAAVNELKNKLKESEIEFEISQLTDISILRFYRGRQRDFDKAHRAIIRHIEWRVENKVEEITPESIHNEIAAGKIYTSGKDHNGSSLITVIAKNHNKDKRDIQEIKKFIIYNIETAIKCTNPATEKLAIVFDLDQFGLYCMDYEAVKLLIEILQYNYPDTLDTALIINAPMLFSACWMVIKPWLDPVTAAKCKFIKKSELKDYINILSEVPEQLLQ